MRKNIQRINALILALILALSLAPMLMDRAFADQPDVEYIERTWESPSVYDETLSFNTAHPGETYNVVTSSTDTLTEGWWVVPADTTISSRVQVSGKVHLIITAGKTLTCEDGIGVPEDSSLTVYGGDDSSSVLDAKVKAGGSHAAIGGAASSTGGEIIIKSGIVNVSDNKGSRNAGIGGGDNGTFQLVEIYGGNITATGGDSGPGIGNGAGAKYDPGESGNVCIYGGNIKAVGTAGGAGIGGGAESYGVITEVNGGTVIAEGGSYSGQGVEYAGAGIGSGCNCEQGLGRGIELDAGNITAKGGSAGGAGIGGGLGGAGGFVNVGGFSANNVVVKATGGKNASGIGGGSGKANQGRQVWFDGGTLEAIANEGESTGEGFAIGNAVTEYEDEDLHVRWDAKVTYAASEAGDKTVALRDERVSKAKESKYAKMEACDHGGFNYTKIDGYKHKVECKYCEESHEENHSFEEGSIICTKNCGFDGISVTFSPGENGSGEAYTEKIQPGNYEVPDNTKFTPKDESLPCFSGWSYGSGKEAFPGEKLQITEDTEFTARWLSERDRVKVTLRWSSIDGLDKVAPKPIWLKKDEGTMSLS